MRDGKTRKRRSVIEAPRMQDFLDAELRDGDRFEIGGRRFLLATEEREREPDAYELKS